jgi:hypothetical protein
MEKPIRKFLMWLWIVPIGLLMAFGALIMGWDMVRAIPGSIHDALHPKVVETTCQTLMRTMKPSDEGYDAMVEHCSIEP